MAYASQACVPSDKYKYTYRVPQKKLSFVEIGCGKYITAVTPPFKIVLALIYPRHSTGDPEHSTGGIGGAHGRGGGVGVGHQACKVDTKVYKDWDREKNLGSKLLSLMIILSLEVVGEMADVV